MLSSDFVRMPLSDWTAGAPFSTSNKLLTVRLTASQTASNALDTSLRLEGQPSRLPGTLPCLDNDVAER